MKRILLSLTLGVLLLAPGAASAGEWVLATLPQGEPTSRIYPTWTYEKVFDTAGECEEGRDKLQYSVVTMSKEFGWTTDTMPPEWLVRMDPRCVPAWAFYPLANHRNYQKSERTTLYY